MAFTLPVLFLTTVYESVIILKSLKNYGFYLISVHLSSHQFQELLHKNINSKIKRNKNKENDFIQQIFTVLGAEDTVANKAAPYDPWILVGRRQSQNLKKTTNPDSWKKIKHSRTGVGKDCYLK